MVEKNTINKIITSILLIIFIVYVLNHTFSAYNSVYRDDDLVKQLNIETRPTNKHMVYNNKKHGKWFHRINSIEHIKKFENQSLAFELDILFIDNNLYVAHDVSELATKVSLKEYLSNFDNLNGRKFWFDIKNMDSINYESILYILDDILSHTNNGIVHKSDIIIESSDLASLKLIYKRIGGGLTDISYRGIFRI